MSEYEYIPDSITTLYYEDCCKLSNVRWDILVQVWIQKDNRIRGLRTELIVFDDIRELSEENKQIIRDLFDESIYDLESFLNSLFLMNEIGINYNDLATLSAIDLDASVTSGLSSAVTVSRSFKGSISKMFNKIISPLAEFHGLAPDTVALDSPYSLATKKNWIEVMFNQNDYVDNNKTTYNNLVNKLNEFNDRIDGNVGGMPVTIIRAYYNIE